MNYFFVIAVALVMASGCQPSADADAERPVLPKVNLPDSPTLELPSPVQLADDGSYTVSGILAEGASAMGTHVRVSGRVLERHTCTDAEPGTLCVPAHVVLVDNLESPRTQLLVVAWDEWVDQTEEGEIAVVRGRFGQWTDDRWFVRSEGLLQVPREEK